MDSTNIGMDNLQPKYSAFTGFIYIFNLIVGTGALAIPGVVAQSGYVLSSFVLILLAFVSYITVTFIIEAMSISNALLQQNSTSINEDASDAVNNSNENENSDSSESARLIQPIQNQIQPNYSINRRIELGEMSQLYFKPLGQYLFYICLIIYLYGDLSIYITVVSKSLRDVTCSDTFNITSSHCPFNTNPLEFYRFYTLLFITTIGPLSFFQVSKTKYLQISTTLLRWIAFVLMIFLAVFRISKNELIPPVANYTNLPGLFGVSIYSFMCHHSLPSLVTPISNQSKLSKLFMYDYSLISTFYILLSITGVFAFYPNVNELYTLNFIKDENFISYLLALFPVFTLSSNFPIISITLKNNLKNLFCVKNDTFQINILFTLISIIPPFVVSVFVSDVQFLVNFTGSFAGAGIQYVVPSFLVFFARKRVLGDNPYASPFKHTGWILGVLFWTIICVFLVSLHLFYY